MARTAVVALGGNAITRSGQAGTSQEQATNARSMAHAVCRLIDAGWRVVLVHGNGPQVGNIAIQQEEAAHRVPELPLFWQNAMTVGQLGSLISLALHEAGNGRLPGVVTIVTHVVVDAADPAFARPTKPIGPFMTADEAAEHAAHRGWTVAEDAGRGYRRIVASPRPLGIVELDAIRALVDQGVVVVAAGGGGLPVVAADGGGYLGLDAVIDKDLTAQRLATALDADALVLVTDVAQVMLDHGTPAARPILEMTVAQAQAHAAAGQFPEGSMGPKMRAAVQFVREGGSAAVITNADLASASLGERPGPGTRIVPDAGAGTGTVGEGAA
ncbi:MAG: carbamate kinase [Pseudonocardia sp.]